MHFASRNLDLPPYFPRPQSASSHPFIESTEAIPSCRASSLSISKGWRVGAEAPSSSEPDFALSLPPSQHLYNCRHRPPFPSPAPLPQHLTPLAPLLKAPPDQPRGLQSCDYQHSLSDDKKLLTHLQTTKFLIRLQKVKDKAHTTNPPYPNPPTNRLS